LEIILEPEPEESQQEVEATEGQGYSQLFF
jgi:hypothetical protein